MPHTILMGDPTHFSIKGGANPHTRDRWGRRKTVDKAKAIDQWHNLKSILESNGIEVWVVPPNEQWPGTVYPANAGFMASPAGERGTFFLSNLLPSRVGEQAIYRKLLESKGIECRTLGFRFEGEADFFPAHDEYIFTSGPIEEQRFVPHWGLPPWRRVYGFRSDEKGLVDLQRIVTGRTVRTVRLTQETHYHGDTVLCAFGKNREYLLAYVDGLETNAAKQLQTDYGHRLIALSQPDAFSYAANSFQFIKNDQVHLVMHNQVSTELQQRIKALGIELIVVDVSEFLKKGGGSVKCMIGDLEVLTQV